MSKEAKEGLNIVELSQAITTTRNLFNIYAKKIESLQNGGKESKLDDATLDIPQKFVEIFAKLIPKPGKAPANNSTWDVVKHYKDEIAGFFDFVRTMKHDEDLFNNLKSDPVYYYYCKLCQDLFTLFATPIANSQTTFFEYCRPILAYCGSSNIQKGIPELSPKNVAAVFSQIDSKMQIIDGQFKEFTDSLYTQVERNLEACDEIYHQVDAQGDINDPAVKMQLEMLGPPVISSSNVLKMLDDFDPARDTTALAEQINKYSQGFFRARSATLSSQLAEYQGRMLTVLTQKAHQEQLQSKITNYQASEIEFEAFYRSILTRITELENIVSDLDILQRGLSGFGTIKEDLETIDHWFNEQEPWCKPVQYRMANLAQSDLLDNEFKMAAQIMGTFGEQLRTEQFSVEDHNALKNVLNSFNTTSVFFEDMGKEVVSFVSFDIIFDMIEKNHKSPQNIRLDYMEKLCNHLHGEGYKDDEHWQKLKNTALYMKQSSSDDTDLLKDEHWHQQIKMSALNNVQAAHEKDGGISRWGLLAINIRALSDENGLSIANRAKAYLLTLQNKMADEARWDLYLKEVYDYDKQEFCEWAKEELLEVAIKKVAYYRERVKDYEAVSALKKEVVTLIDDLKEIKNSVYYSTGQQRVRCEFLMHKVDRFIEERMRWIYKLIERLFEMFRMKNESKLPHDLIAIRASRRYQDALQLTLETQQKQSMTTSKDPIDQEVAKMVAAQSARNSMYQLQQELTGKIQPSLNGRGFFGEGKEARQHVGELVRNSDLSFKMRQQPVR